MRSFVERHGWICPRCDTCWSPEITYCGDCSDEDNDEDEEVCKDCGVGAFSEVLFHSNSTGWDWVCEACETMRIEKNG